jgi:hypothetical protein
VAFGLALAAVEPLAPDIPWLLVALAVPPLVPVVLLPVPLPLPLSEVPVLPLVPELPELPDVPEEPDEPEEPEVPVADDPVPEPDWS